MGLNSALRKHISVCQARKRASAAIGDIPRLPRRPAHSQRPCAPAVGVACPRTPLAPFAFHVPHSYSAGAVLLPTASGAALDVVRLPDVDEYGTEPRSGITAQSLLCAGVRHRAFAFLWGCADVQRLRLFFPFSTGPRITRVHCSVISCSVFCRRWPASYKLVSNGLIRTQLIRNLTYT